MAKNAEWFKGIFAEATKLTAPEVKNREYVVLYRAVMNCVRGGENDQGYVRNQLGYNSDNLPTTVPSDNTAGKVEYFTRSALFAVIWNKVLNDVRAKVADATTNEVWGIAVEGMRGINGYLMPYCGAIERESGEVSFVASKNDAKVLGQIMEPTKTAKSGQKTFTMPMAQFVKEILDKKLPGNGIAEKHDAFAVAYRNRLGKYTAFRSQRLSNAVADIADGLEW